MNIEEYELKDLGEVTNELIKLMTCMLEPETIEIQKKGKDEYLNYLEKKFEKSILVKTHYNVFRKVISGDNIDYLIDILDTLNKLNKGEIDKTEVVKKIDDDILNKHKPRETKRTRNKKPN